MIRTYGGAAASLLYLNKCLNTPHFSLFVLRQFAWFQVLTNVPPPGNVLPHCSRGDIYHILGARTSSEHHELQSTSWVEVDSRYIYPGTYLYQGGFAAAS